MFNDQDDEFDNVKLTNLDSITVNRNTTTDNDVSTKKDIDDELNKNTILRFNQAQGNYLLVSDGDDDYVPKKQSRNCGYTRS